MDALRRQNRAGLSNSPPKSGADCIQYGSSGGWLTAPGNPSETVTVNLRANAEPS